MIAGCQAVAVGREAAKAQAAGSLAARTACPANLAAADAATLAERSSIGLALAGDPDGRRSAIVALSSGGTRALMRRETDWDWSGRSHPGERDAPALPEGAGARLLRVVSMSGGTDVMLPGATAQDAQAAAFSPDEDGDAERWLIRPLRRDR